MIPQSWGRLFAAPSKRRSTSSYELSDILRESLDSPIPDEPCPGWFAHRERIHTKPSGRLAHCTSDSYISHAELEDYHADDELSELCSTPDTAIERSLRSYDCFIDHDHTRNPPATSAWLSDQRRVMASEQESVPAIEQVMCANYRRYEVIEAPILGWHHKGPPHGEESDSVYQKLHDRAVGSKNSKVAIEVWQGHATVGSLDTPVLPPPSFLEQFAMPSHRINADLDELSVVADEQVDHLDAESLGTCPMEGTMLSEELSVSTPRTDISFEEQGSVQCPPQRESLKRLSPVAHRANAVVNVNRLRREQGAKEREDLRDYQAAFRRIHGNRTSLSTYTPQKVQKMISILNERTSTVDELKSFWDSKS